MGMKCLEIIIAGVMSFASPGVLENVAENRAAGITAYNVPGNWRQYDTLLAVEDCTLTGKTGQLSIQGVGETKAIIVDCQAERHRRAASLSSLGLLADTQRAAIVHRKAILTIKGFCQQSGLKE